MDKTELEALSFGGFITVRRLLGSQNQIPVSPGVYAVTRTLKQSPSFRTHNTGGWFRGRDPSVVIARLEEEWVSGTQVLYFGKAKSLRERISTLLRFAQGHPAPHWGGRFLWQVEGSADFKIAWKETLGREPFDEERGRMGDFKNRFGTWPFANIQSPRQTRGRNWTIVGTELYLPAREAGLCPACRAGFGVSSAEWLRMIASTGGNE